MRRDGVYSLRYRIGEKRKWENLTCELFAVQKKSRLREAQIENDELKPSPVTPKKAAAITLKQQEEKFLELKKLTKKSDRTKLDKHTVSSYQRVLPEFLAIVGKTYAKDIDGTDLRRYIA